VLQLKSVGQHKPCEAVKIWEYHELRNATVVYHYGTHSCACVPSKPNKQALANVVKKYPKMTAVETLQAQLVEVLSKLDVTEDDLRKVHKELGCLKDIHQVQQQQRQEDTPLRIDFDALVAFKCETTDKIDKFLIFKMNGRGMNDSISYVFKSSTSMAELAVEMDTSGQGCLKNEFAYVDAKHDRVQDYKTLTLWTEHQTTSLWQHGLTQGCQRPCTLTENRWISPPLTNLEPVKVSTMVVNNPRIQFHAKRKFTLHDSNVSCSLFTTEQSSRQRTVDVFDHAHYYVISYVMFTTP